MSTMVTLDPDVERMIEDAMRLHSISFEQALNEAARRGLSGGEAKVSRPFRQKTFCMGGVRDLRWDKALAMADSVEDGEALRRLFPME